MPKIFPITTSIDIFLLRLKRLLYNSCLALLFFLFASPKIHSQQPAYFMFGEDQFRGIQIYDVIQDNNQYYWFATNEGIFYYDFYQFHRVECSEAKSNSVFNFVSNEKRVIYCHSLNGQVFKIQNKKCEVIYELKDDEQHNDVSLSIAKNGNVIIGAKKIIVLDEKGNFIERLDLKGHVVGEPYTTSISEIVFHISASDSILKYYNGSFIYLKLSNLKKYEDGYSLLSFFASGMKEYAIDKKTKIFYEFETAKNNLIQLEGNELFSRSQSIRLYPTGNELWVAGTLPGVALFNSKMEPKDELYYKDYFISDIYKDSEGNFLLSTFDKGVLVVPDLYVPDVIRSFRDDPINSLHATNDSGLVMGSSQGKLLIFKNGILDTLNDKGQRPIEGVYGNDESKLLLFDNGTINAYNLHTKETINIFQSSLKDAVFISKNTFVLGTNSGVAWCKWLDNGNFKTEWIEELHSRVYSIEYDAQIKKMYIASSNGMYTMDSVGFVTQITYNKEILYPHYLHYNSGKIYAIDKKNGIVILQENKALRVIKPIVNEKKISLSKIIIHNNSILAKSTNGFYQFDLNGKLVKSIDEMFDLASKRVIDFTIVENEIWVSHSGGVQKIDINYNPINGQLPTVRINHLYVNDQEENFKQNTIYNSTQRKIKFVLSSPTLRNQKTIRYHYQLKGYDTQWYTSEYNKNEVTYNALAPGKYIFLVKVENQGVYSETIKYSFEIEAPYYFRWWFIAISIVFFLLVVFMFYKRQLKIQQKKADFINELNASKLTAIQSQMNPHFIFNSLNSIQDLVLKGDIDNSYTFITKFSNLVRRTLNYSDKDFIEIEQELKLIELYLSLEKLRFKENLDYTIDISEIEDILVPPMLIQPFIENALLHGLLHKEGIKKLSIKFTLAEVLICEITDNGIGRAKSKEIKERQRTEHESFSTNAIKNRFDILERHFGGSLGFIYEDLYEDGIPSGTKVILKIPIKRRF